MAILTWTPLVPNVTHPALLGSCLRCFPGSGSCAMRRGFLLVLGWKTSYHLLLRRDRLASRGEAVPLGSSLAPCGAASPSACVCHPASLGGDWALIAGALFIYWVGRFFSVDLPGGAASVSRHHSPADIPSCLTEKWSFRSRLLLGTSPCEPASANSGRWVMMAAGFLPLSRCETVLTPHSASFPHPYCPPASACSQSSSPYSASPSGEGRGVPGEGLHTDHPLWAEIGSRQEPWEVGHREEGKLLAGWALWCCAVMLWQGWAPETGQRRRPVPAAPFPLPSLPLSDFLWPSGKFKAQ